MDRCDKAVELKHSGNNCCQAVLLSYADLLPLTDAALKALGSTFGAGMGSMEATCGALCGAEMVMGLLNNGKAPAGAAARTLYGEFKRVCGATGCGDLKGISTGKMLCSCDDCVRNAVKITDAMLSR